MPPVFKCSARDAAALGEVELTQPFSAGWGREGFASELENKFALILGFKEGEELLGFIAVRSVAGTAELLNFAAVKKAEGNGIGTALINALFAELKQSATEFITLEVSRANARALSFYKKNGFAEIGVRKDFYGAGKDAVLMRKNL